MLYSTAIGISMGNNINSKMRYGTLTSPGFPSYSEKTETEASCRLTQAKDEAFIMTALESWATFEDESIGQNNRQLLVNGITMHGKTVSLVVMHESGLKRYVNYSNLIGIQLNEIQIFYKNSPKILKFNLNFTGNDLNMILYKHGIMKMFRNY